MGGIKRTTVTSSCSSTSGTPKIKHPFSSRLFSRFWKPSIESIRNRRRVGALGIGLEALAAEVDRIRHVLTGAAPPSDLQLFSQLKALGEIKTALAQIPEDGARKLEQRVVQLLDATLKSGRFAEL